MKSYTTLRNLASSLVDNAETATLTLLDQFINDGHRLVCGERPWPFLPVSDTLATVASQQAYEIPARIGRLKAIKVTVSSTIYTPRLIVSESEWQRINMTVATSDIPQFFYVRGRTVELYPKSATTNGTITFYGNRELRDINVADYTTGQITTLANAGTAVTGSSTVWTAPMAGRYIRITYSDTANTGDGFWYEISSVGSNTALTLVKPYEGTAISAGSAAYTIGMMPLLPEAYHVLPVYYAAWQYWLLNGDARAGSYKLQYDEMLTQMGREYGSTTDSPVVDWGNRTRVIRDPNDYITLT